MKKVFGKLVALASAAVMTSVAIPAVSAVEYGWQEADGKMKYFMANDEYAKGVIVIDGIACSFTDDGIFTGRYTGIARKYGKTYYYDNGVLFTGGWLKLGGGTYYFYPDGSAATGIVTLDGVQYYFSSDGKLNSSKDRITVTADKSMITLGRREKLEFTVKADTISGSVSFGEISAMHQLKNGVWYKVKPDPSFCVNDVLYYLGTQAGYGDYAGEAKLSFIPEAYKLDLHGGHYRIEIPLYSQSGTFKKHCEFDIVEPAVVITPSTSYNTAQTKEIFFTAALNKDTEVYAPEVCELFFYNDETKSWERVEPKSSASKTAAPSYAYAGQVINSRLDLTRYNTSALKTGKYRVMIGDGLSCEFRLVVPFEVSAVQSEVKNARSRKIILDVYNKTDSSITLKGYGELYRREKGKWVKIKLKSGKKLDTEMTVGSMQKRSKSFTLTNYYSLSDLKKGLYCIKATDQNGYMAYAQFKLE